MPIPFTFDEALHICRDMKGAFIPSVSQILERNNLSFPFRKFVDGDVLDRRSRIGTEVHHLTDIHDEYGDIDPTFLNADTAGYVESWIGLKRLSGFTPIRWSIRRCELINQMAVTGETDKEGFLGKHEALVDLKTGASASDSWGFQLAPYEMLRFRSPRIGRMLRLVAHLQKDGAPGKLIEYGDTSRLDGVHYGDTFLAALHNTYVAMRRGHLSERDFIEAM